jgi:putative DNA methylase
MLLTPCAGHELSDILQSLKSYTANEANKLLHRRGQFWQPESFDRWVRDANHFAKVIAYIENNPVKARLCKKPEDWPYSSAWFRKRGVK